MPLNLFTPRHGKGVPPGLGKSGRCRVQKSGTVQTYMLNTSRASATPPVIAAAATITGLIKIVRPVGLP